jgi:tripartite ATP-independent transporter DctM subunit
MIGIFLMITCYFISLKQGYGIYRTFPGIKESIAVIIRGIPALIAPVIILGGILFGVFSPTEAGGVAVLYVFCLGLIVYRTLNFNNFGVATLQAAKVTAASLLIVAAACLFSRVLTFYMVHKAIIELLRAITMNKIFILLILNAFLLIMGMFMDAVANLIILGPLLMPICVTELGMDPLHFGVMFTMNVLIGVATPPFAMCLFIASSIANCRFERVSKAIIPFVLAEIAVLMIVVFVPPVTLWFPRLIGF